MANKKKTDTPENSFCVDLTFDVYVNAGGGGAVLTTETLDSLGNTVDPFVAASWVANQISVSDYRDSTAGSGDGDDTKLFLDWGGVTVRVSVENDDGSEAGDDTRLFALKLHGYLIEMGLKGQKLATGTDDSGEE